MQTSAIAFLTIIPLGIEKMAQDMLFEWAEKDPQPTVAKLCACLEAADLSRLAQGVHDKVNKEKQIGSRRGPKKGVKKSRTRKVDDAIKVPVSEGIILNNSLSL